jgi:hypothetical protein
MTDASDRLMAWLDGAEHPDATELRAQFRRYAESSTRYVDGVSLLVKDLRSEADALSRTLAHVPQNTNTYVQLCTTMQRLIDILATQELP